MIPKRQLNLHRWTKILFFGSLVLCLGLGNFPVLRSQATPPNVAATPASSSLVQQGIDHYQAGDLPGAIDQWQQSLKAGNLSEDARASILKYLARAYQQIGQIDRTIDHLDQAIAHYRRVKNPQEIGRLVTEKAQAYSDLGQHRRAIALLCSDHSTDSTCDPNSALEIARRQGDAFGEAAALGSLGNAYYAQGEYDQAIDTLEASRKIAERLEQPHFLASALNNLGNLYASLAQRDQRYAHFASQTRSSKQTQRFIQRATRYNSRAITHYETSLQLARTQQNLQDEVHALLNLILPYHRRSNSSQVVSQIVQQAQTALARLPDSREKAYASINLAVLLEQIQLDSSEPGLLYQCSQSEPASEGVALLNQAVLIAKKIGDQQAESFALGGLGHVEECRRNYSKALNFTQQAELAAANQESVYLWQWQTGRILKAQDKASDAVEVYEQAVNTLQRLQGDIAIAPRDLQLDFRETVEAVYLQLAELKLKQADRSAVESLLQTNLRSALETLDKLRLSELRNYLGSECELPTLAAPITSLDRHTAILNSLILSDRIAIIVALPDQKQKPKLQIHWVPIQKTAVTEIVNSFRQHLEQRSDREEKFKQEAQQLYDWFIRPIASDLEKHQIRTLVFVQDGILRSVPMATLYDGKEFLMQRYAIANTPSLFLPQSPEQPITQVLAFGLTMPAAINEQTFFAPLQAVKAEIDGIKTLLPKSKGLFDRDFTHERLEQELQTNSAPVLHLATHARFGVDAKETFLVMGEFVGITKGNATRQYNETLSMTELYRLIKTRSKSKSLELLTLTGCETAVGSDREALGIAGVALQAGVESAIASLWKVDDEATAEIITLFYQHLQQGLSKVDALQATQKAWLKAHPTGQYSHPGYWSPLILIGNWM